MKQLEQCSDEELEQLLMRHQARATEIRQELQRRANERAAQQRRGQHMTTALNDPGFRAWKRRQGGEA